MKKSISVIIFLLVSILLPAQSRFSCSLELMSGAGVWKGPLFTVAPELVVQYDLGAGFKMGVGTGARYTMPCLQYITNNGTHPERSFCNELDIPVFLRFGYGKEVERYVKTESGERGTPSHSISADVYNQHLFTPSITLRYGFFF